MIKIYRVVIKDSPYIIINFPYNKELIRKVKSIKGIVWNTEKRYWIVDEREGIVRAITDAIGRVDVVDSGNLIKSLVEVEELEFKLFIKLQKSIRDISYLKGSLHAKWDSNRVAWGVVKREGVVELIQEYFKHRIYKWNILDSYSSGEIIEDANSPKEFLIIRTSEQRLKLIFKYNIEITNRLKMVPYSNWDRENRWWTIPFSETYKQDLISYVKRLSYTVSYREERKRDGISRIRKDDVMNYRKCPIEMKSKLIELRYSENTINVYTNMFLELINYYPTTEIDNIDERMIVVFLRYLVTERKVSLSYQNQSINAIKFYYEKVLRGSRKFYFIDRPKKERTLPIVLSREEVRQLLDAVVNMKHKAILMTTYSAGLRISEVVNLKWEDVDRDRMQIRIVQSKGRKDRYVKLSEKLIPILEEYSKAYKTKAYIFEGAIIGTKYSTRSIQNMIKRVASKAGINKRVTVHTLRHSFATHCLESGVDLRYIQSMLGHENVKTTEIYTHITTRGFNEIKSPLDDL